MARQRHLRNAPITEAMIDLRVKVPTETQSVTLIHSLHERIQKRFPQKKEIQSIEYHFEAGPPLKEKTTSSHIGYRYDSADGRQVIQAKLGGFTFSWLKPYETWEVLRSEAYSMWQLYQEIMKPDAITRVATRFINQIELPGSLVDFDDYLTAAPVVPKALPQALASFFSRIAVPDEKNQVMAMITQVFQPGTNPQALPVILDIDVFKEKLFENQSSAWDTIDTLRSFKNLVFFDSITEKTAELYE